MTSLKLPLATSVLAIAVTGAIPAVAATTGYSLGNNGATLVTMNDLDDPTDVSGVDLSDNVILNALAYRPNTDQLYGFAQETGIVYTVDRNTGQVAAQATIDASDPGVNVGEVGMDFNNVLDAARIVSTNEDNVVYFPDGNPDFSRVTDLAYNAGDVNEGEDPSVFANAYTNQVPMPEETTQFVLDSELDILATLDNNEGTINTIGQVAVDGEVVDFSATGGFDIFSTMVGDNTGYALLSTVDGEGLYRFDSLEATGANGLVMADFLGFVGDDFGNLDSLAVFDNAMPAPIPLPASALLLGGAMAGFGALRRRRKSAA